MVYRRKIEDLKVVRNGCFVEYRIPENDWLVFRYDADQVAMFVGKPGCQTQEELEQGVRLCLEARLKDNVRPANILDWGDPAKEIL